MMEDVHAPLVAAARGARAHAYAPYSGFLVGAALRTPSGVVYTGTNVENASYGLTICAERVAMAHAISQGERVFETIAIVTDADPPATPCGACRQFLAELGRDLVVVCANVQGSARVYTLSELLPDAFLLTR